VRSTKRTQLSNGTSARSGRPGASSTEEWLSSAAGGEPLDQLVRRFGARDVVSALAAESAASLDSHEPTAFPDWLRRQADRPVPDTCAPTVLAALIAATANNGVHLRPEYVDSLANHASRTIRIAVAKHGGLLFPMSRESRVIDVMLRLARDSSPLVREWAICALGQKLFARRADRLRAVRVAANDSNWRVRAEAAACLAAFAWSAKGNPSEWYRDVRNDRTGQSARNPLVPKAPPSSTIDVR
jgi:hypothetical protein